MNPFSVGWLLGLMFMGWGHWSIEPWQWPVGIAAVAWMVIDYWRDCRVSNPSPPRARDGDGSPGRSLARPDEQEDNSGL